MESKTETVINTWVADLIEKKGQAWVDEVTPKLMERHHTDDAHFAMWMTRLNSRVNARIGMSYDDLEDWDFWSAYAGDLSPMEAADDMLADAGFDIYEQGGEGWS